MRARHCDGVATSDESRVVLENRSARDGELGKDRKEVGELGEVPVGNRRQVERRLTQGCSFGWQAWSWELQVGEGQSCSHGMPVTGFG